MKPLRAILGFFGASAALVLGVSSAQAATSLSSIPNACWTTDQPFTLVENEYAKLTWDVYGNLKLTNHMGNGSSISWGLESSEPLTGSNAGKLCFGNGAGRLRIHTSTGTGVWNSGTDLYGNSIYSAPNGTLSIDECTIRIKDTSGVVQWEEKLPQCELRSRKRPAVTKCWSKGDTQLILSDEDLGRELVWENGNLWLRGKDGLNSSFMDSGANSKELCHQSNGDLVIFDTSGNVLKHLGYGENVSLDECGVEFWSETNYAGYSGPHKLIRQRTGTGGTCTRRATVKDGVCWDRSAAGTLLQSGFTRLEWTTDGRVRMLDSANNQLWAAGDINQSLFFCFHEDGNMGLYRTTSNGWAMTWGTDIGFPNPLDDYALELKSNVLRVKDAYFDAQCSGWEVLGVHPGTSELGLFSYDEYCGDGYIYGDWYGFSMRYPWITVGATVAEPLPGGGYSYVKEWYGGNSDFGAGAWLVAGAVNGAGLSTFRDRVRSTSAEVEVFEALPTTGLPSNYAEAIADGGASVTLFGESKKLVEGIASAEVNNGPKNMVKVMVGGATVYSSTVFGDFNHPVHQTFIDKDAQFVVGGIPIIATFEATGTVGMRGNIDYNQNSDDLTCTITPFAAVDAFGSVGIGVSGFSVGVEGELKLVEVGFPLTNKLNTETFAYTASSDVTISSLEGSLSVYADATLFKATKEVVSFDGYASSSTLFKVVGSLVP
jgi:hypothetical protein